MLFANPGGSERRAVGPDAAPEEAQAPWLDLVSPTPEETAFAERATGLCVPSREELSEIEHSSRTFARGDALYLSTPMIHRVEGERASSIAPLGFVFSPQRLITVRFAEMSAFDQVAERFARPETHDAPGGRCSASAFIALLDAIIDRLADVLEQLAEEYSSVSHRVFAADKRRKRTDLMDADLRATLREVGRFAERLSNIRDSLLGMSRIANFVAQATRDWLPDPLKPRLKTLRQDLGSLSDYEAQMTNKVQFLLDATLGFINIEQNNVIKVLTIVSVVGVPPTLVAGIYGMNFEHMPELHWPYGYAYGLGVIALSAILPLIWFWRRGWI